MRFYDPYGSLTAALVGLEMHEKMSRGSGRTETMLAAAADTGGNIVCTREAHDRIYRFCRQVSPGRHRDRLTCIAIDPTRPDDLFRHVRQGPVYFDHEWLRQSHLHMIEREGGVLLNFINRFPSPLNNYDRRMSTEARRMGYDVSLQHIIDPNYTFKP